MELSQAWSLIRTVPDFPEPGIRFLDITPLLREGQALRYVAAKMADARSPYSHVVGVEARGFILGAAMAIERGVGFVPLRKAGKLPYQTIQRSYGLEYGDDVIEAHIDALTADDSVIIVDDVLATGGTLIAAIELIRQLGAKISEVVVLIEITELGGRAKIAALYPEIEIRTLFSA